MYLESTGVESTFVGPRGVTDSTEVRGQNGVIFMVSLPQEKETQTGAEV